MFCNGACAFCSVPCTKSVVKENLITEEDAGTYEIKKNLFGKEKVRKVKNESRTLGIEYIEKQ